MAAGPGGGRRRGARDRMNVEPAVIEARVAGPRGRVADYFELTKPRVTTMVLVTMLAGFYLGADGGSFSFLRALNLLIGAGLASGGTLALNEWMERGQDAVMNRTCRRPLPDGRLRPAEAFCFGSIAALAGIGYLFLTVNGPAALVVVATSVTYLFAYTPLKRVSWVCAPVGAIPGALPPVAGWAAARQGLGVEPMVLFAIMFIWQFLHALSIGKLYREDYRRAGLWLLPLPDKSGRKPEDRVIVLASIALIAVSALPTMLGFAGLVYLAVAIGSGIGLLIYAAALVRGPETAAAARRTMFATLVYLPVILLVMVLDRA